MGKFEWVPCFAKKKKKILNCFVQIMTVKFFKICNMEPA